MNTRFLAAVLSLCTCAIAATAAHAAESGAKAEEEKPDPDAVTCKTVTLVGSRIPVRMCRTNLEWEAERQAQIGERRSSRRSSSRCEDSGRC